MSTTALACLATAAAAAAAATTASSSSAQAQQTKKSLSATSSNTKNIRTNTKTIVLIRHGKTEMNEYLATNHWADENFVDPLLFDTKLSKAGIAQARLAQVFVEKIEEKPDVIVASPLTRAITTAKYVYEHDTETKRVVCALARERVFHASDHGIVKKELAIEHPEFSFDDIENEDEPWWFVGDPVNDAKQFGSVVLEPVDVFEDRMDMLIDWLNERPEETIALVAHWGVCFSLTGEQFENCEARVYKPGTLRPRKGDFARVEVALSDSFSGKLVRNIVFALNKISDSVPISVGIAIACSLTIATVAANTTNGGFK